MKYKSEMKQGDLFQFCTRHAMVTDTEEELIPCELWPKFPVFDIQT
jgi:hypothetical protein